MRRWMVGLAALGALAVIGSIDTACQPQPPADIASSVAPTATTTALTELNGLTVAPNGSLAGYSRAQFGPAWPDNEPDGCDARDDVLARDAVPGSVIRTDGCKVTAVTVKDPYDADTTLSVKSKIQIDHVFPLAAAWMAGASRWTASQRVIFANDEDNLLAVQGSANEAKGDKTPDEWLPPNTAFRVRYAEIFIHTAAQWKLAITSADKAALTSIVEAG